jgi:hypothetical protein
MRLMTSISWKQEHCLEIAGNAELSLARFLLLRFASSFTVARSAVGFFSASKLSLNCFYICLLVSFSLII